MIVLDTETTGLQPRVHKPTHVGIYMENQFQMCSADVAEHIINLYTDELIMHNGKFDTLMMWYNHHVWIPWKYDTMLLSQLYDSRVKHKLGIIGAKYVGEGKFGDKKVLGAIKKGEFWLLPHEIQLQYLRRDCEVTWKLFRFFENNLSPALWKLYNEFDLPVSLALAEIELNGFSIDEEKLNEFRKTLSDRYIQCRDDLKHIFGDINFNSPKQLLSAIRKVTGFDLKSTNERTLSIVSKHHKGIGKLFEYREINKYLNTYLDGVKKNGKRVGLAQHIINGKVYPQFHLAGDYHTSTGHGTETGRTSSSDPNLQNQPRPNNGPVNIRSLFVASPGHTLLAFDYNQLELKVGAFLSGEYNLLEGDPHREAASILFGVPESKVTSEMRNIGKTSNFAEFYGAQRNKIFYTSGGSIHTDEYIRWFKNKFAKAAQWTEQVHRDCKDSGSIRTYLGRVRYMHKADDAANSIIQGTAGDIGKEAVMRVHKAKYRVLGLIHDEVIVEVPDKDVEATINDVPKLMTEGLINNKEIHDSVKLGVSVKMGVDWGNMKELEKVK